MAIIRMPSMFKKGENSVAQSAKVSTIGLQQAQKGHTAVSTALAAMKFGDAVMESKPLNALVDEVKSWGHPDLGERGKGLLAAMPKAGDPAQVKAGDPAQVKGTPATTSELRGAAAREASGLPPAQPDRSFMELAADAGNDLSSVAGIQAAGSRLMPGIREAAARAAAEGLPKGVLEESNRISSRGRLASQPAGGSYTAEEYGRAMGGTAIAPAHLETARYVAANAKHWLKDISNMFGGEVAEKVDAMVPNGAPPAAVNKVTAAVVAATEFGQPVGAPDGAGSILNIGSDPPTGGPASLMGTAQKAINQADAVASGQRPIKLLGSARGRVELALQYADQIRKQRALPFPSRERLESMDVNGLIALGGSHSMTGDQMSIVEYLIGERAISKGITDIAGDRYIHSARKLFSDKVSAMRKAGRASMDPVAIAKDLVIMEHKMSMARKHDAKANFLTADMHYTNELNRTKVYNGWMNLFMNKAFLKTWSRRGYTIGGGRSSRASDILQHYDYDKDFSDKTSNGDSTTSNHAIHVELGRLGADKNAVAARKTILDTRALQNKSINLARLQSEGSKSMSLMQARIDELDRKKTEGKPLTAAEKEWKIKGARLARDYQAVLKPMLSKEGNVGGYVNADLRALRNKVAALSAGLATHDRGKPDKPRTEPARRPQPATGPKRYGSAKEVATAYENKEITREEAERLITAGF